MVSNSGFFCVAAVHLLLACAAFEQATHHHEEHRNKNTASTVPVTMPPSTPVPMARWLAEPRRWRWPGHDTQTECHRGHDDGTEAQMSGFQGRLDEPLALCLQVFANSMIKMAFLPTSR